MLPPKCCAHSRRLLLAIAYVLMQLIQTYATIHTHDRGSAVGLADVTVR